MSSASITINSFLCWQIIGTELKIALFWTDCYGFIISLRWKFFLFFSYISNYSKCFNCLLLWSSHQKQEEAASNVWSLCVISVGGTTITGYFYHLRPRPQAVQPSEHWFKKTKTKNTLMEQGLFDSESKLSDFRAAFSELFPSTLGSMCAAPTQAASFSWSCDVTRVTMSAGDKQKGRKKKNNSANT